MIYIERQHFNLNRILFLVIGLWPYRQSRLTRCQIILFLGVIMSFLLFQFATLMNIELSFKEITKILTPTFFIFIYIIHYISFWTKIQTVKFSLEYLQHICNALKDENEIAIIAKCGYNTKNLTFKLMLFFMGVIFIGFAKIFLPYILDVALVTNKSRSYPKFPIAMKYFIDQEKYYYIIFLHAGVTVSIGTIALIATGTTLIGFIKHACGMFKVASYRIEKAIPMSVLVNIKLGDEIAIYRNMIHAIDIYHKATQFVKYLNTNFEITAFSLAMVTMFGLSFSLYQVSQLTTRENNTDEIVLSFACVIAILTYMFFVNLVGQDIIDHNNYVFFTVYNVQWYVAPLHVQKFILFLLLMGGKPFNMNICKLLAASFEGFAALVNASMSYFTFMYSTHQ